MKKLALIALIAFSALAFADEPTTTTGTTDTTTTTTPKKEMKTK